MHLEKYEGRKFYNCKLINKDLSCFLIYFEYLYIVADSIYILYNCMNFQNQLSFELFLY